MVAVIVGIKYCINALRNILYRFPACQTVLHDALAVGQVLPHIDEYPSLAGGYFCYAPSDLIDTPMNSDVHMFVLSRRRADC